MHVLKPRQKPVAFHFVRDFVLSYRYPEELDLMTSIGQKLQDAVNSNDCVSRLLENIEMNGVNYNYDNGVLLYLDWENAAHVNRIYGECHKPYLNQYETYLLNRVLIHNKQIEEQKGELDLDWMGHFIDDKNPLKILVRHRG